MNKPQTIREIHERVKKRHSRTRTTYTPVRNNWCIHCGRLAPCSDFTDAVAALAILDNAALVEWFPEGWCLMSDRHPLDTHLVVPDPVAGLSPSREPVIGDRVWAHYREHSIPTRTRGTVVAIHGDRVTVEVGKEARLEAGTTVSVPRSHIEPRLETAEEQLARGAYPAQGISGVDESPSREPRHDEQQA